MEPSLNTSHKPDHGMEMVVHRGKKKKKHKRKQESDSHLSLVLGRPVKINNVNRVGMFLEAAKLVMLSGTSHTKLQSAVQYMKRDKPDLLRFKRDSVRDLSRNILGTWEPTYKFRKVSLSPVAVAAGVTTTVIAISNQDLAAYDEFEALFDEVQPVGPFSVTYLTVITSTAHYYLVGAIDYEDNTALSNLADALSYDTAKVFIANAYLINPSSNTKWYGHVQGYPDKDWVDATTTANYAYMKFYFYGPGSVTETPGYMFYTIHLRFRQVRAQ
jgi:hypothetical protein